MTSAGLQREAQAVVDGTAFAVMATEIMGRLFLEIRETKAEGGRRTLLTFSDHVSPEVVRARVSRVAELHRGHTISELTMTEH